MKGLAALTMRELKKWYRSPVLIFMTMFQPILWLTIFGRSLNLTRITFLPSESLSALPASTAANVQRSLESAVTVLFGTTDYFTFIAAGMLPIVIMFTAMFSGMSLVWDRRFGFLNKLLAAPIPRTSILMSKVSASLVKGLAQALVLFGVAMGLGLNYGNQFGPLSILGIVSALFLLSLGFSALFVGIATGLSSWETMVTITNLVNLPLMFASSALVPVAQMPEWLQGVASVNPITFAVNIIRSLILASSTNPIDLSVIGTNYAVLAAYSAALTIVGLMISRRTLAGR